MKVFIAVLALLFTFGAYAQTDSTDKVFDFVEQMPEFPGGNKAIMQFLAQNIGYSRYEKDNNVQGKVVVKSVVDTNGTLINISIIKAISPGLDSEAIKVVKLLPKFTPGYQSGKPVKVFISIPVSFKLEEPKVEDDPKIQTDEKVYQFVEQNPTFPGGDGVMMNFIDKNLQTPKDYKETGLQPKVLLRFVVNEDGSVSNVQVIRKFDPAFDAEAIRVIKLLPHFTPGKQNGQKVKVYFNLPVSFKLTEHDTIKKTPVDEKTIRDPYYKDAVALAQQGKYSQAVTISILSILLFPNDYLSYELLADCDKKLNWNGEACNSYKKAKELGSPKSHICLCSTDSLKATDSADHVYSFVEQNPTFPGGDVDLMHILQRNISYPQYEKDYGIAGNVLVRFVIDVDGSVENPVVVRPLSPGLDEEAIRVVKLLPKFKPGYQKGRAVKVYFNVPVIFRIDKSAPAQENIETKKIQFDTYYRSVLTLVQQKDLHDAENMLTIFASKFPHDYFPYEFIALCEATLGDAKNTCDNYKKAKEQGSPYASFFIDKICK